MPWRKPCFRWQRPRLIVFQPVACENGHDLPVLVFFEQGPEFFNTYYKIKDVFSYGGAFDLHEKDSVPAAPFHRQNVVFAFQSSIPPVGPGEERFTAAIPVFELRFWECFGGEAAGC